MTKQKLLQNLRESPVTKNMNFTYKVIADKNGTLSGHNVYVLVLNCYDTPIFLLRYRLDLDFLADFNTLGHNIMESSELKAFEFASK